MLSVKNLVVVSFILTFLTGGFFINASAQQKDEKVRISPKASFIQKVGFTDVTISYSRPGVKRKKIWVRHSLFC